MMNEIDLAWVIKTFPRIFEAYGVAALTKQVKAFNTVLRDTPPQDHEISILSLKMLRHGYERPHYALMNSFAESSDKTNAGNPLMCRWLAPLTLLERRLEQLAQHGFRMSEYRTMITATHSFDSLVAEVEVVGALLNTGGAMTPHVKTDGASATNYDVEWQLPSIKVRGDVKYFRDWLRKPENPILETLQLLLRGDTTCGITVKLRMAELMKDELLGIALEVLELYRAASGIIAPPPGVRIVDGGNGMKAAVATHDAAERLVREVVLAPNTRPESIVVIESGFGDGDEDEESARRNLRKAAQQVPKSTSPAELAVAFIGCAVPASGEDVQNALFGKTTQGANGELVHTRGFFSPDTGETDLAHVQAVIFFSFFYEEVTGADQARVRRVARVFTRPNELTPPQEKTLEDIQAALSATGLLPISFPP